MANRRARRSTLAGTWYAESKESLTRQLESLFLGPLGPGKIPRLGEYRDDLVGLISPHAGYVYSGQASARAYFEVAARGPKDVVVLLGPNHSGTGSGIAASPSERWETPLGEVEVDLDLAKEIAKRSGSMDFDETAHRSEHSLEIQLPFLQYIFKGRPFKIVPISIWMYDLNLANELGSSIGSSLSGLRSLVIASTDMSHYVPADVAVERDKRTLESICAMDESETWRVATQLESLCGLGPVLTCIIASKKLGADKGRVITYYHSGDVTKDHSAVVGYSAVAFEKR